MAYGAIKHRRSAVRQAYRLAARGRKFDVRVFVGRTASGTYWARACTRGKPGRFSSKISALKHHMHKCGFDKHGSSPTAAAKKALASLARELR